MKRLWQLIELFVKPIRECFENTPMAGFFAPKRAKKGIIPAKNRISKYSLRYFTEMIRGFLRKVFGPPSQLVPFGGKDAGKRRIINPKVTSSSQIITPTKFTITYKDALTVVREYDYINPRPSHKQITGGGEQ